MHKLTAMYPYEEGVRFDFDYYTGPHDRLVKERLEPYGLTRIEVDRGVGAPGDEPPPCVAVGTLWFEAVEGIAEAWPHTARRSWATSRTSRASSPRSRSAR